MRNFSNRSMGKLDELYDLALANGIPVDENCPQALVSMSVRLPGGMKIVSLFNGEMENNTKLECFAHEMGHCMTDSFYAGYSPFELRAKHENRANEWAANRLIPFDALCAAVKGGCRELWELAEYFDVSCSFVEKAIAVHKRNGCVVPPELYAEY